MIDTRKILEADGRKPSQELIDNFEGYFSEQLKLFLIDQRDFLFRFPPEAFDHDSAIVAALQATCHATNKRLIKEFNKFI